MRRLLRAIIIVCSLLHNKSCFYHLNDKQMNRNIFPYRIVFMILCFFVLMPVVRAAGPKKPLKCVAPASPKWLIGYSDITTLLSMEACAGVMGIHGVMGCNIAKQGNASVQQSCKLLRDLLEGQVPRYELSAHKENILGRATGTLVGGNLATFAPLLCSQVNEIGQSDIILFVEEVEETHHNIDRLFNMLKMSGVLAHCKGIVLGDFTDCTNDVGYESVEAMLREYIAPYHIPLLCSFPAGHEKLNLPLVIGAPVTMDVRADGATLTFDIPGEQQAIRTEELRKAEAETAETEKNCPEIRTIQEMETEKPALEKRVGL